VRSRRIRAVHLLPMISMALAMQPTLGSRQGWPVAGHGEGEVEVVSAVFILYFV
jgi:hypothetical protein